MPEEKFVDVEKLISSKNPKLVKWLPGFVLRYLKRILHQDEINEFLARTKGKKNIEFCEEVVRFMDIKVEVEGLERIPKDGKITIAMNHPLGGMDAMILIYALRNQRTDVKFIVNDLLMNLTNLSDLFVGINKHGKNHGSTRGKVKELFESESAVCIFPAGMVSRKFEGKIQDFEWKKTFVTYARSCDRTIIPVFIEGKLSKFFYRLYSFRKFIGIKTNIEMLYLSNEMFKQRHKTLKFIVGEPIPKEVLFSDKSDRKVAQVIKKGVYQLKKEKTS